MKKVKFFLFLFIICNFFLAFVVKADSDVVVHKMDIDAYTKFKKQYFDVGINTLKDYKIGEDYTDIFKFDVLSESQLVLIPFDEYGKCDSAYEISSTKSDYIALLSFENIGYINGRGVSLDLSVKRVAKKVLIEGNKKKNEPNSILTINGNFLSIGSAALSAYTQSSPLQVDLESFIYWTDTKNKGKEVVNLPFMSVQADLDVSDVEAWAPISGYTNEFFIYKNVDPSRSKNEGDFDNTYVKYDINNKVCGDVYCWYPIYGSDTNGDDQYLKTGVYSTTYNGHFTSRFFEAHCATAYAILNQFADEESDEEESKGENNPMLPHKSSTVFTSKGDKAGDGIVYSIDDIVTYKIEQNIGEKYVNIFSTYDKLIIKDIIPSGLKFKSAKMYILEEDEEIHELNDESIGSLKYDEVKKEISFEFNKDWISDLNNFKGQIFILEFSTTISKVQTFYTNKSTLIIDDTVLTSEQVDNFTKLKPVNYKYISADDYELPSSISTTTGSYAVIDDNNYLLGSSVSVSSKVKIGDKFEVYDDDILVGYWEFIGWDKTEQVMTSDGITFVGTWKYVKTSPHYVPSPETGVLTISFVVVLLFVLFLIKRLNKKKLLYKL